MHGQRRGGHVCSGAVQRAGYVARVWGKGASRYDVRIRRGRGVIQKCTKYGSWREFLKYKSVPNADEGSEGVKKAENFADIISGSSQTREPTSSTDIKIVCSPSHILKCRVKPFSLTVIFSSLGFGYVKLIWHQYEQDEFF